MMDDISIQTIIMLSVIGGWILMLLPAIRHSINKMNNRKDKSDD